MYKMMILQELFHLRSFTGITEFKSESLKPTDTKEADSLPTVESIAQEMEHKKFVVRQIPGKSLKYIIFFRMA